MFANIIDKIKSNFSISWVVYFFLGIVAFNFADNIIVFGSISLVANILMLIFSKRKFNGEFFLTLLLCVLPLVSLGLFTMTSHFNYDPDVNISTVRYVFLIISFISIPFLGFQSRVDKKFDVKKAIKTIYIMLALWMLINFFITLIQFGPFYTFIYKDRYFFDYGHIGRLAVSKIAYMLLGFEVTMVSIELFTLVACVLTTALLGLFFTSIKEDKTSFIIYLATGVIGALCVLLTLSKQFAIGYFAFAVMAIIIVLFGKKIIPYNKVSKIVIFSIIGLAGLYFVLVILNAWFSWTEVSFFVNKLTRKYYTFIDTLVTAKSFKGFTGYTLGIDKLKYTGSWMFDMLAIGSVFGWVAFIIFVVVIIVRYVSYYKSSEDDKTSKLLLLGIVLSMLLFSGTCYNSTPYYETKEYLPLFFLAPFLVVIFFYGYMGKNEEEIKV